MSTETKEVSNTTEGEALKVDFSSSISSLFPPLFKFLEIFGPDRVLWCGIVFVLHLIYYTAAPRSLLFLLPYPLTYLMPLYMSMTALQRAEDPKSRAFWLSYWACLLGIDLVEMAVLGRWAQALLYWPGVKILVALFLMMETADFSVPPQPDKALEEKQNSERRAKRKLWTAQGLDKYKIRSDEGKIKAENARELEKSRKRPRRFHAYMLVGPFLPDKAHAGGSTVYYNTEKPEPKIDKTTGRPVKTKAETRDEVRDKLLDKMDRRKETMDKGKGVGNWLDPVIELGGKVIEHNPFTDEYGNIASQYEKGDAATTSYGTPWDNDPDMGTISRGDVATSPTSARRAADVSRIKFAPQIDKRDFATDHREARTGDTRVQRRMEDGTFAGYKEHTVDEISKLSSTRVGYRESAREEMYEKMMQ